MFKLNISQVLNTFFTAIVLISLPIFSTAQSDESKAREYFEQKDFDKALPFYKQEYTLYPSDAMVQYHYGVCLTETGQWGSQARKLLLGAAQDTDTPPDVFFYIAKNYHAAENFELALNYYRRFEDKARKRERRSVDFESLYEKCIEGVNPFTKNIHQEQSKQNEVEASESDNTAPAKPQHELGTANIQSADSIASKNTEEEIPVQLPTNETTESTVWPAIPALLSDTTFDFTLSPKIRYQTIRQFKTASGQHHFIEGWMNREKLANNLKTLENLRKEYQKTANQEEQEEIANELIGLEQENFELKPLADKHYWQAREAELSFWESAPAETLKDLKAENDSIENSRKQQETVFISEAELINQTETEPTDTTALHPDPESKPAEIEEEKDELIYRIQIGAFSKGLPEYIDRLYKKLSVLRRIDSYTDDRGVVVYTVGELRNFDDAVKLQEQIRQEGVKDAFVVAYHNGKRITLKEAREITKND